MTVSEIRTPKTQKASWGTSLQVSDDLWRLRLRNPNTGGRDRIIVNTYVYAGADTLAVIDPGWPSTVDHLEAALAELGLARDLADVDYWLYTHAHIDHMGAAALLEKRSKAPHIAAKSLTPFCPEWHRFQDEIHDWRPWIQEAFASPHRERLLAARQHHGLLETHGPAALTRTEFIDFGERIQIGDLNLEFVDARGHDPHHGAFFERERGWLFSGDVILAVPTPICRSMHDDLDAYRGSIARLAALPASLILPGHGLHRRNSKDQPFEQLFERSLKHVSDFEKITRHTLSQATAPLDLYEIAIRSTPEQKILEPEARWWVHMALIDSHLATLVEHGFATRVEGPSGPLYHV